VKTWKVKNFHQSRIDFKMKSMCDWEKFFTFHVFTLEKVTQSIPLKRKAENRKAEFALVGKTPKNRNCQLPARVLIDCCFSVFCFSVKVWILPNSNNITIEKDRFSSTVFQLSISLVPFPSNKVHILVSYYSIEITDST